MNFTSEYYLNNHLLYHIKQPWVSLTRIQEPPIKITLKSRRDNSFEIVSSPNRLNSPEVIRKSNGLDNQEEILPNAATKQEQIDLEEEETGDEEVLAQGTEVDGETPDYDGSAHVTFSPNFVGENGTNSNDSGSPVDNEDSKDESNSNDYGNIPGAEPTPPPEPSPEFPKIRIKTGLLKEPLTITEITDDTTNGEHQTGKYTFI